MNPLYFKNQGSDAGRHSHPGGDIGHRCIPQAASTVGSPHATTDNHELAVTSTTERKEGLWVPLKFRAVKSMAPPRSHPPEHGRSAGFRKLN